MHSETDTHPSFIFSFCPKCGHHGFVFDGVKAFTCEKCGFRYYINAATAVAAVLQLPDQRIILTKRKFEPRIGTFDLPGGFVDINERVEDAVKREIREELGIEVKNPAFLASFPNEYVYRGISYFTCDLAFVCPVDDISNLKAADDVAEAIVIHPNDIDFNTISFPSIVHILKTYMTRK
jgi:ADP-ribose pyrophosphatase YjhB (NUDIX family)